jgi:hypothetical protein
VLTIDTREQTDYGVLRTYFLIGHTSDSPNQPQALYANRGFIQFAGFTFGLAQSFFDFYSAPATSYFATNTEDTGDGGWKVAAFTGRRGASPVAPSGQWSGILNNAIGRFLLRVAKRTRGIQAGSEWKLIRGLHRGVVSQ